jgi:N-acetylmuramic acid 6-phosphate etherase
MSSEDVHPRADELDDLNALELVAVLHAADHDAVDAMSPALESIARAVELIAGRLGAGGRLHYFGAGTSGLIAAMDASECPDTFGVPADMVQAHIVTAPADEDDDARGRDAAIAAAIAARDVVVGVSASGTTPFVVGALCEAAARGAAIVALSCNRRSRIGATADVAIEIETGPEVIAGSTRLKAGTVQKLALNMLTTAAFTRLGHTHRGRMIGVVASNEKLRNRAARIVADLSGLEVEEARRRLDDAGGDIRAALRSATRP